MHEAILMSDVSNLTITSSGRGTIDGRGQAWWQMPLVGYLLHAENRPRLLRIQKVRTGLYSSSPPS